MFHLNVLLVSSGLPFCNRFSCKKGIKAEVGKRQKREVKGLYVI